VSGLELVLFSTEPEYVVEAHAAGITTVVVDWENTGKEERQRERDTQVNRQTIDDLARVRAATAARIVCRIDRSDATTAEIEAALDGGADEILVPMVRSAAEVERILEHVDGRAAVGILVETAAAVAASAELASLPLARAYVGLNDLAIDRRSPSIFAPLLDGTIERLRAQFECPFGFAGLTLPDRGSPIPCRLLVAEMARLDCGFGVLRRSFLRDVRPAELRRAVRSILAAFERGSARTPVEVAAAQVGLEQAVRRTSSPPETALMLASHDAVRG
jgi:hypothetical protein